MLSAQGEKSENGPIRGSGVESGDCGAIWMAMGEQVILPASPLRDTHSLPLHS